jgi:hypothetical protein
MHRLIVQLFCLHLLVLLRAVIEMCPESLSRPVSPANQTVCKGDTRTPEGTEPNDPIKAYRIQGIPLRYDVAELDVIIRLLLRVKDPDRVIIRCLTTNVSKQYRGTKSAVFNLKCAYLPKAISGSDQKWKFTAFRGSMAGEALVIDSSFKGLTVLYEPEQGKHQFE